MPEGDSILRTARTLHRALAGHEVVRFETVLPALLRVHQDAPVTGRTIERVAAAGKHVLMHFSGDLTLRTHMRMNGSWHMYRPGERWQRPHRDMRIVLATTAFEAVAFNVPVAEFLEARELARQPDLRSIGPDLLGPTFDAHEAIRRFREHQTSSVADALINQRIVAGAGNVYKSEILFICRISPFRSVESLSDEQLTEILATARKYLQSNVDHPSGGIVTYRGFSRSRSRASSNQHYVYARRGLPCRTCGKPIQVAAQGVHARLTYWCATCQPDQAGAAARRSIR